MKSILACCKLYISESRNSLSLEAIEQAVKPYPEVAIVNKFTDEAYNRVGYTVVSRLSVQARVHAESLRKAVFDMVREALRTIDLQLHGGTHPRLGVVDHICFHPSSLACMDQVAGLAKSLAADIGQKLEVPTFLYGAAHHEGRPLDSIRRDLGYFQPSSSGNKWVGGLGLQNLHLKPDAGPDRVVQGKGVVVVGATRWVDNYNIPVWSNDIAAVRRIARLVSGRGGGLESVQAMALVHTEDSIEVACNLLEPGRVGADQVQHKVEELAANEGMTVGKGYFTDFSQDGIIEKYLNQAVAEEGNKTA
ncbi:hypothetical protein Taro_052057 [Colocasia esculenta]|uniref:Formiminotransferase N-terminal subdomain domain-containing protein n=1 Tax=Colocasia esculenta TaxID=4460 RepID=A0A843XHM1_COLES|nr:hypothetical protein [Colocasia esculenta]